VTLIGGKSDTGEEERYFRNGDNGSDSEYRSRKIYIEFG
jgi:hypothetical protein